MLSKNDIIKSLRLSRTIIYIVTFCGYIYGRFLFDYETACNRGYTCLLCGLRTAMYYIEHGKFADAFNSNKLCVVVVIFFLIATIDTIYLFVLCATKNKS